MKKKLLLTTLFTSMFTILAGCDSNDGGNFSNSAAKYERELDAKASQIVSKMSTREKIAQKIIMSFRYDCSDESYLNGTSCVTALTEMKEQVAKIISEENIGGVILFANNAQNPDQTAKLIWDMQDVVEDHQELGLFITVDQEGGNVVRLPRATSTNFVGNMGLGAVYEANHDPEIAYRLGTILASEVKALGFNVNFAPDVDVQSNSLNPVINVRSFGESPETVGLLGGKVAQGMASEGVIATFKHFPGHGDTATDSHYSMPVVNRPAEDIRKIELLPYKTAIEQGIAPDMIMTAHIQFPTLDSEVFTSSKTGEEMPKPATLSRKIQHDILRGELGYKGVTITDALDMQAIKEFFYPIESTTLVFQSGVDIALMPVLVHSPAEVEVFTRLLDDLEDKVGATEDGISEQELNESVQRIVKLKLKRGILNNNGAVSLTEIQEKAKTLIGSESNKAFEKELAAKAITLLKNENNLLPLDETRLGNVFVVTPTQQQLDGFKQAFSENGISNDVISGSTFAVNDIEFLKSAIDKVDTVIIGTQSTAPTPVDLNGDLTQPIPGNSRDANFAIAVANYAFKNGKNVITVALRAPYDVVNYDKMSHVSLVAYNFYGYENNAWIGESIRATVNAILGKSAITGKLPVNIYDISIGKDENGKDKVILGDLAYPLGGGLNLPLTTN